jgi:CHAT domain-containing protein
MAAFHRALRAGAPAPEALRRSLLTVRADPRTAHPYYWGNLMLVGQPRAGGPSPSRRTGL